MGNDNHVVASHRLYDIQGMSAGALSWWRSQLWLCQIPVFFVSHFLSTSQNFTVKVRVDRNVRRHKFTVNNPLHAKKKKTMRIFLVELRTCRAFFCSWWLSALSCDDFCFVSGSYS
jgi:hypothetical protein